MVYVISNTGYLMELQELFIINQTMEITLLIKELVQSKTLRVMSSSVLEKIKRTHKFSNKSDYF